MKIGFITLLLVECVVLYVCGKKANEESGDRAAAEAMSFFALGAMFVVIDVVYVIVWLAIRMRH